MKVMLLAFVAIALIAVGANLTLDQIGFATADKSAGETVRLGE